MAHGLTMIQRETLEFIREYITRNGRPPTMREIGSRFGITNNATNDRLMGLERKGYIARGSMISRGIRPTCPPSTTHPDILRELTELIVSYATTTGYSLVTPEDVIACAQVAASMIARPRSERRTG